MTSAHCVPTTCPTPLTAPDATRATDTHDAERIGDAIADLAARMHAATYELLVLIQRFDACAGWSEAGALSCAHPPSPRLRRAGWLNWRIGLGLGAAREKVRVAHALGGLPLVSAAMRRGALSYSKVRAITRVATPANEARLVDLALSATASQVERVTRAWRRIDRTVAAAEAAERHLHRHLDIWLDDDGMVVLRGRLSPAVGAVVQRALEAASDRLRREAATAADADATIREVTPGQRRADALAAGRERPGARAGPWLGRRPVPGGAPRRGRRPPGGWRDRSGRARGIRRVRSRGDVAADRMRRLGRGDAPRAGRLGPRRGPEDTDDSPGHPARAGSPASGAVSPAARPGTATPATSGTGPTAASRVSTTWSSCAATTARCTKTDSPRRAMPAAS